MTSVGKAKPKFEIQAQKAGYMVTLLSILFFGVGFTFDTVSYYSNELWFLFFINTPVLIIMVASLIHLFFSKKNWSIILIIIYSLIILNLILSNIYRNLYQEEVTNYILVEMILGLIIVATSAYALKAVWTYIFSFSISLSYIFAALYSGEEYLLANIILMPMILLGTAFVTHTFIRLFKHSQKIAIETENEADKLRALMEKERKKVNNTLKELSKQTKETDSEISGKIDRVVKTMNHNLPQAVVDYTDNLHSNENLFFNKLLKTYPNLTSTELKLCYMLVKNMTSKEIAQTTSCTINSVKVFRSRLRKKMGLSPSDNLVSYLKKVELSAI
jgi:DNA-binding CsgD family transcriptional regulator